MNPAASCGESSIPMEKEHTLNRSLTPEQAPRKAPAVGFMPAFLKKHGVFITLCCLYAAPMVVVGSFHVSNIYRDSDLDVSRLGTWEADEGFYTYNAVNLVRYGNLITKNDINFVLHCPILTLIQTCYFRVLGISIPSSRIQGVLSFILALLLLMLLWNRLKLLNAGLVSAYIISFNYMLFGYTRLGLAESHAGLLFVLITFVLFHRADPSFSYRKAAVLGVLSFVATFVKPSLLVLPAAVCIFMCAAALLEKRDARTVPDIMKKLGFFSAFFSFLSLMLIVFLVLPHLTEWNFEQKSLMYSTISVRYVGFAFLDLFRFLVQIVFDPWHCLPFLLALSSLPILVRNYSRRQTDLLDKLQIWCWSVVVMQAILVGVNSYQPSRYYVAMIWPLGVINSVYFFRLVTFFEADPKDRFAGAYRFVPIMVGIIAFYLSNSIPLLLVDAALVAFVVSMTLLRRKRAAVLLYSAIFVMLPIGSFGTSYLNWTAVAGQSLYDALEDIGRKVPDNCVIAGRMAPFIALGHPCKAYICPAAMDGKNPCPDYIILNKGLQELDEWTKKNPRVFDYLKYGWDKSFTPLRYRIMGNYYSDRNTIVLKVKKEP